MTIWKPDLADQQKISKVYQALPRPVSTSANSQGESDVQFFSASVWKLSGRDLEVFTHHAIQEIL